MKKNITIPDHILIPLKVLAAKANMNLTAYIAKVLEEKAATINTI